MPHETFLPARGMRGTVLAYPYKQALVRPMTVYLERMQDKRQYTRNVAMGGGLESSYFVHKNRSPDHCVAVVVH